jgi:Skp family chaperone for outer membrane proteins
MLRKSLPSIAFLLLSMTSSADAQSQAPKTAVIDVMKVMARYEKQIQIKKQFDDEITPIKAEADRIKQTLAQSKREAEDPKNSADLRDAARQNFKSELAKLELLDKQTKLDLGKRFEARQAALWKEIHDAVAKHAEAEHIDVVIAYGNLSGQESDAFPNVKRKMNAVDIGAGVPIYVRPGLDITDAIVNRLNNADGASKKEQKNP